MITIEALCWGVGSQQILHDVCLTIPADTVTGIVGPNGSGKTSLLHLMAGVQTPTAGKIFLDQENLTAVSPKQRARRIALVEQHPVTHLDLSVTEVVELGRIPHKGPWPGAKDPNPHSCSDALREAGATHLAHRRWQTLSGGERQRVHLARALAQEPEVLLLDEPTNHLDLRGQLDFLEKVSELPLTTVAVLHDLDLAVAFCEYLVVMHKGRIVCAGPTPDVLTADVVHKVFDVSVEVRHDADRRRVTWLRDTSSS